MKFKHTSSRSKLKYTFTQQSSFQYDAEHNSYSNRKQKKENVQVSLQSSSSVSQKSIEDLHQLTKKLSGHHYEDSEPLLCKITKINVSAIERANKTIDSNDFDSLIPTLKEINQSFEEAYFINYETDGGFAVVPWFALEDAKRSVPTLFANP